MKVRNMVSERSGKEVANQFVVRVNGHVYFQSYDSVIVDEDRTEQKTLTTLDERYWNYSRTTGKYRNQFLGETKKETQAKIDSGEYKLANLN